MLRRQSVNCSKTVKIRGLGCVFAAVLFLPGCLVVDVGVTNPVRGLRTVAVVPFFNQSDERIANGRRMAELYTRELQKVPGVEVIPVGVVETTMRAYGLQDLAGPDDAVKLAALLNVDALVIGTITDYSPYDPPRIGMSVAWYSPYRMRFANDVPVDPEGRNAIQQELTNRRREDFERRKRYLKENVEAKLDHFFEFQPHPGPVSGDPPSSLRPQPVPPLPDLQWPEVHKETVTPRQKQPTRPQENPPPKPSTPAVDTQLVDPPAQGKSRTFHKPIIEIRGQSPARKPAATRSSRSQMRQTRPIMSYTKVFDAADSATAAGFRDFLELTGDDRGGDWSARLLWADEFPRFAARMMIVEMFQLHGGEARRRVVVKWRKHQ